MTIRRQFTRYLLVGVIAYGVDVLFFAACRAIFESPVVYANTLARGLGAFTAFSLNRSWTFIMHYSRLSVLRYITLWIINTLISTQFLHELVSHEFSPMFEYASKAGVEMILIVSNFLICKIWIFKKT